LLKEALKSWIQRSFFDLQQVIGSAFDVLCEGVAMQGVAFYGPKNHHL